MGRGGESEEQRDDVQADPGMSRWIWTESRGGGASPDEQITLERRDVGGRTSTAHNKSKNNNNH